MKARKTFTSLLTLTFCASMGFAEEKIIVLNEGNWQADNGRVTYFENGEIVSNEWFRDINGAKLGDTPNDVIQINDNLLAICVNWSNIIQFIDSSGKAVAVTEGVPNNRRLVSDGRYVYVTSYAHQCTIAGTDEAFVKGYVAKIDLSNFSVIQAAEVGYEPEGIALYQGKLFVANTGGYANQEKHDYEKTVSVIDAESMNVVRTVDTEAINLYGSMSQSGQYLCINSAGDYYNNAPATVIFDCQAVLDGKPDAECSRKLDYAATYNCTATDGAFYVIGSKFSYNTGGYEFNYLSINPREVMESDGQRGVKNDLPGTLVDDFKKMTAPYSIYVNPYSGYIYATDAGNYASAGYLYQWTPEGSFINKYKVYINPAHTLALAPQGHFSGVTWPVAVPDDSDAPVYNLQGIPVTNPLPGQIYIRNGKKFILTQK